MVLVSTPPALSTTHTLLCVFVCAFYVLDSLLLYYVNFNEQSCFSVILSLFICGAECLT